MRTRGMGIDIVDVVSLHPCRIQRTAHGDHAPLIGRLADAAAIAREAVTYHLGKDVRPAGLCMIVVLQDQ